MNLVVVIQARTGSSRLPQKTLLPLAGKPLLLRMIERVQAAKTPFQLVVATTIDAADDPIRELCAQHKIDCFSGHSTDLLDRHYKAARAYKATHVVKIPSDCPLIDPTIIDEVLTQFSQQADWMDYMSNLHPPSWPDGNDVEIMTFKALEVAWREAKKPHEREHTTPFLWDQPERFRIGNVRWSDPRDLSMSLRLTIDYQDDYVLIKKIYDDLWSSSRPIFLLADILKLLDQNPSLTKINERYNGVNWYRHHLNELSTIDQTQTRVGL